MPLELLTTFSIIFYSVTFVKPFSLYPYLIRDVVLKPDNIIILI